MLKNVKNICDSCEGGCSHTINDKNIGSCNNSVRIGYESFVRSKLEMMKNPFNEMGVNSKESSYVHFLREQEVEMMKMHSMRSNSIEDICRAPWDFSMDMFKKIDMLFIKWSSWYNKMIIMFKYLVISGKYCPHLKEFIFASIKDYYEGSDIFVRNEISHLVAEMSYKYFEDMKVPIYNGDFIDMMQYITKILAYMYKIMIIEYAQEEQIYNFKTNILYYSPNMRDISIDFEKKLMDFRITQILSKHKNIELRIVSNGQLSVSEENYLVNEVFSSYSDVIVNYNKYR